MLKKDDDTYKRIEEEASDLKTRVTKLEVFVTRARKGEIENITLHEIHMLEEQLHYMRGYLRILNQRLASVT